MFTMKTPIKAIHAMERTHPVILMNQAAAEFCHLKNQVNQMNAVGKAKNANTAK